MECKQQHVLDTKAVPALRLSVDDALAKITLALLMCPSTWQVARDMLIHVMTALALLGPSMCDTSEKSLLPYEVSDVCMSL